MLRGFLHAQAELGLQEIQKLLVQFVNAFRSEFTGFHVQSPQDTIYKNRRNRQLGGSQRERFAREG
ncbi:MAG: hypothetical protein LBI68_02230, partial [Azoarcus sp.]|nr:hypothetical protein [Azoarcus sp.]